MELQLQGEFAAGSIGHRCGVCGAEFGDGVTLDVRDLSAILSVRLHCTRCGAFVLTWYPPGCSGSPLPTGQVPEPGITTRLRNAARRIRSRWLG